jgi:Nucleotidyl transferase AbiEii toxin, Type IV TA system
MFYLNLFKALNAHNIDYLLVGGLAINLHGVPRMTMDVDLVIALDADNIAKLEACVNFLGLHPNVPVKLADLADANKRELLFKEKHLIALSLIGGKPETPTVDIVIHHPLEFKKAYQNKIERDISGTPVMLACIEDMITMKKAAGRAQDLADIKHLERFLHEKK